MEFRGLTLDRFQEEAVGHIDNGHSVIVSAATGTGKTLVADYVIDRSFKAGRKVFYTSPIKALSNQKFREFKALYGEHNVGILTGDVVINADAPLLIMTTEIYRNMLLAQDTILSDLQAVIFDEIHYLGDIERGTVWEEALIFSPDHVRLLCLSATIPNAKQFANWIESVHDHEVKVVTESKRAVPLEHRFFDNRYGLSSLDDMRKRQKQGKYPTRKHRHRGPKKMSHLALVKELKKRGWLPCIYFCFSRRSTMEKADQLAQKDNFLTGSEQQRVQSIVDSALESMDSSIRNLDTTRLVARCLKNGIAFHHAGLLPRLKELVETVFAENLLRVLYATETFAVGINLPAKAVCFDSLEKYDGTNFRYLKTTEYFQLAGRAGRRGMDKVGHVVSLLDGEYADLQAVARITDGKSEKLMSQYRLSYNTILNLVDNHTGQERKVILRSSFYTYQKAGKHSEQIMNEFEKKYETLVKLGYIENDRLTEKGRFASKVYQEELILAELFTTSLVDKFDNFHIALLCAALEFEPKPRITFKKRSARESQRLLEIFSPYAKIRQYFKKRQMYKFEPMLKAWFDGKDFADLLEMTTMPEGDIIRFMRRIIDVMHQVQHAARDRELQVRIQETIKRIDRDIVEVRL